MKFIDNESCGKKRYASKKEANTALNYQKGQSSYNGKRPVRSYYCDECEGWHLTSRKWAEY